MSTYIGDWIREARIRADLSQAQLAAKSGVTATTISGIERGNSDPRIGTVAKLADALDLEFECRLRYKRSKEERRRYVY